MARYCALFMGLFLIIKYAPLAPHLLVALTGLTADLPDHRLSTRVHMHVFNRHLLPAFAAVLLQCLHLRGESSSQFGNVAEVHSGKTAIEPCCSYRCLHDELVSREHLRHTWRPAEMLRADLAAAEIDANDESGQVVDFHALRHTFCTMLAQANVPPKTAQVLARHSSFAMTFDVYARVGSDEEARALTLLPDLCETAGDPKNEGRSSTGSDATSVLATSLANDTAVPCISVPRDALDQAVKPTDTLVEARVGSGGGT